jgi:spore germination protein PE
MLERTSVVDNINVKIISFASLIQLGDSCIINGLSRAIALQRETEFFYGNEGDFSTFGIFSEPIPFQPLDEPISFVRHNPIPIIKVNKIGIIGISSSSILHVGNSKTISMEARIKHIRQLHPSLHEQEL